MANVTDGRLVHRCVESITRSFAHTYTVCLCICPDRQGTNTNMSSFRVPLTVCAVRRFVTALQISQSEKISLVHCMLRGGWCSAAVSPRSGYVGGTCHVQ